MYGDAGVDTLFGVPERTLFLLARARTHCTATQAVIRFMAASAMICLTAVIMKTCFLAVMVMTS